MSSETRAPVESKVVIFACESLEREIRAVADHLGIAYSIRVFGSRCHRRPGKLAELIEESIESLEDGVKVFMAYGECYAPIRKGADKIYQIKEPNCAAILLGGSAEYDRLVEGSYFLTPHLAIAWREYFLGSLEKSPVTPRDRRMLAKWFAPVSRLVMIDTGMDIVEDAVASARELSELVGKPLVIVKGGLDIFRKEYDYFCGLAGRCKCGTSAPQRRPCGSYGKF